METSKLGAASIFNVQLYKIENASTKSESNVIFDYEQPALSTWVLLLYKVEHLKWLLP